MRLLVALAIALSMATTPSAQAVDYERDVKPLLKERCFACHGALKQEGGLRLDTAKLMLSGGDSGAAIEPSDAENSYLLERILAEEEDERMPPEGQPLTAEQIATITEWINQGAAAPEDELPENDPSQHWAFLVPTRPAVPSVNDDRWVRNPIDAFIHYEHKQRGLVPSQPAEKHELFRRVHLDLTGLPPTRQQLHDFLADESEQAYEAVVDSLLESPAHGERWARHWMDVWRYSDWYGRRNVDDVRNSYPHIWRWRDWIVNSLNRDKGYDQMIREMLAADEIAPEDNSNIVALGFIVRNWFSMNYDQWKRDLVEHTGKAFLGVRLNCAHCHDHKYDPIPQEEFFKFRAFFEPLELRHDRVPGGPNLPRYTKYVPGTAESLKPITAGIARVYDFELDSKTFMYLNGDARVRIEGRPPVEPATPAMLGGNEITIEPINLPPSAWYPGLRKDVQETVIKVRANAIELAKQALEKCREDQTDTAAAVAKLESTQAELVSVVVRITADHLRYPETEIQDGSAIQVAIAAAVKAERNAGKLSAQAMLAQAKEHEADAKRLPESDEKRDKQVVEAEKEIKTATEELEKTTALLDTIAADADYTPLTPQYPKTSSGRRTALANWIASRNNPTTARVAVNHIWMRHFGRPLVETVFDFGLSGAQPSHPQLLDWLAVEFMDSGWSMKHLHRLIVTSSTYRLQSAAPKSSHANTATDQDNLYWWKFDRQRMQSEMIRDSILHVSGTLDRAMGGQELSNSESETSARRSLYFTSYPEAKGTMQFAVYFDPPNPVDCYRRTESVIPQQALAMTNSLLAINQSRLLAELLSNQISAADLTIEIDTTFVSSAFEQILSRSASSAEMSFCEQFLVKQRELFASVDEKQLKSTPAEGFKPAAVEPAMRARESLVRSLFSHNDFVTIH